MEVFISKCIVFDVDGVLADFVLAFTRTANSLQPLSVQPWEPWGTHVNSARWDFTDVISPAHLAKTWEMVKKDPLWWTRLSPLVTREVFSQIDRLQRNNQVLFVTARVSYYNVQDQTACWLRAQGISNPNVIVTRKKGEIARATDADYHLDDKPENASCVHWMADVKPCRSYLLLHQYTRQEMVPQNVRRVTSVLEFIEDIKEGR